MESEESVFPSKVSEREVRRLSTKEVTDKVLLFVQGCCSDDHVSFERELRSNRETYASIAENTACFGRAFDAGYISLERLLEVLVAPFLVVAARMNATQGQEVHELQKKLLEECLDVWLFALLVSLSGDKIADSMGVTRAVPMMSVKKRATMLEEMLNSRFHQRLAALLEDPIPKVALCALQILEAMMLLPREANSEVLPGSTPLVDERIARQILGDRATMEALLAFSVPRMTQGLPETDLEWLAVRGQNLVIALATSRDPHHRGSVLNVEFEDEMFSRPVDAPIVEFKLAGPNGIPTLRASAHFATEMAVFNSPVVQSTASTAYREGYAGAMRRIQGGNLEEPPQGLNPSITHFSRRRTARQSCGGCGASGAVKKLFSCTRCNKAWYCGKECQLAQWKTHKKECKKVEEAGT